MQGRNWNGRREVVSRFTSVLVLLFLAVAPAAAQITVGDNLSMSLNGVAQVGYDDNWGNTIESNHSLNFGGNGTLSGYYYDPNFLNFNFSPYANQSQANSASKSIFDSSGLELNSGIFGGSHFPGSVSYSKSWNSQGIFAVPGVPDYTTRGSGQGFSVGWGAFLPGLPTLSASFSNGSSDYTVLGSAQNGSSDYKNFNVRSNYSIAGFNLNGGYAVGTSQSNIPEVFANDIIETANSTSDSWFVSASHKLPWNGSSSINYAQTYLNSDYLGYKFNGSIGTLNAYAGFTPTQKFGFSVSMAYTDNLAGSLYETVIPTGTSPTNFSQSQTGGTVSQPQSGGVFQQSQTTSNALSITGAGSYTLASNLYLQFDAQRRQQTYYGVTYVADSYGAGLSYTRKLAGGALSTSFNFADNTSNFSSGNSFSFSDSLGWTRTFANWTVSGDFSYAQNVETYLVTYMNSYYIYSGNVRHRFGRLVWSATGGGSHSAIVNEPHTGIGSESFSTSLGAHRLTLSANYSKSDGYGLISGTGITLPPNLPPGLIPPELLLLYGGTGYAFSLGTTPVRRLSIGASFSRANSNTVSGLTFSANHNEQMFINGNYQFRKLTFNSGYGRLVQGFSASGLPASNVNSFYFGVSRYFNFF